MNKFGEKDMQRHHVQGLADRRTQTQLDMSATRVPSARRSVDLPGQMKSGPSGSNSSSSSSPKRRGSKAAVPMLPGEQSKAERVAQRKNRVLQKRLQSSLHDLARNRY